MQCDKNEEITVSKLPILLNNSFVSLPFICIEFTETYKENLAIQKGKLISLILCDLSKPYKETHNSGSNTPLKLMLVSPQASIG